MEYYLSMQSKPCLTVRNNDSLVWTGLGSCYQCKTNCRVFGFQMYFFKFAVVGVQAPGNAGFKRSVPKLLIPPRNTREKAEQPPRATETGRWLMLLPWWDGLCASVHTHAHASVGCHAKAQFFPHLTKSSLWQQLLTCRMWSVLMQCQRSQRNCYFPACLL